MKNNRAIALLAIAIASSLSAKAAITQVGSRAALNANDLINWGQFSPDSVTFPSGTSGLTVLGDAFTVNSASNNSFHRYTVGTSWLSSAFPNGTALLNNGVGGGSYYISFSTLVGAVGFDIENEAFSQFAPTITAFDANNTALGSVSTLSNVTGDGHFIGLVSDSLDISYILVSASGSANWVIDEVSLLTEPQAVPEVQTWASLAGFAMVGAEALRRRKAAKA